MNTKIFFLIIFSVVGFFNLQAQDPSDGCIDVSQIDSTVACNLIYNPVCGCDDVTYENDCVAENYGGVTSFTWGACSSDTIPDGCIDSSLIDNDLACIDIYDPVCGCDGVTYGNSCYATTFYGITSYTDGECGTTNPPPGSCIDSSLINPNVSCPSVYDPVCGCDGITYSNGCIAARSFGITNYTMGECTSVGIKDMHSDFEVKISPNPVIENIRIEIDHTISRNQELIISIYNVSGQIVMNQIERNFQQIQYDLSQHQNGVYFLKITQGNKVSLQKFLLSK